VQNLLHNAATVRRRRALQSLESHYNLWKTVIHHYRPGQEANVVAMGRHVSITGG